MKIRIFFAIAVISLLFVQDGISSERRLTVRVTQRDLQRKIDALMRKKPKQNQQKKFLAWKDEVQDLIMKMQQAGGNESARQAKAKLKTAIITWYRNRPDGEDVMQLLKQYPTKKDLKSHLMETLGTINKKTGNTNNDGLIWHAMEDQEEMFKNGVALRVAPDFMQPSYPDYFVAYTMIHEARHKIYLANQAYAQVQDYFSTETLLIVEREMQFAKALAHNADRMFANFLHNSSKNFSRMIKIFNNANTTALMVENQADAFRQRLDAFHDAILASAQIQNNASLLLSDYYRDLIQQDPSLQKQINKRLGEVSAHMFNLLTALNNFLAKSGVKESPIVLDLSTHIWQTARLYAHFIGQSHFYKHEVLNQLMSKVKALFTQFIALVPKIQMKLEGETVFSHLLEGPPGEFVELRIPRGFAEQRELWIEKVLREQRKARPKRQPVLAIEGGELVEEIIVPD